MNPCPPKIAHLLGHLTHDLPGAEAPGFGRLLRLWVPATEQHNGRLMDPLAHPQAQQKKINQHLDAGISMPCCRFTPSCLPGLQTRLRSGAPRADAPCSACNRVRARALPALMARTMAHH